MILKITLILEEHKKNISISSSITQYYNKA
jgi:hypothetical protein